MDAPRPRLSIVVGLGLVFALGAALGGLAIPVPATSASSAAARPRPAGDLAGSPAGLVGGKAYGASGGRTRSEAALAPPADAVTLRPAGVDGPVPLGRLGTRQTSLLAENFEGTWPSAGWRVSDGNGGAAGEYYWANKCGGYNSGWSAWALGSGANGQGLTCPTSQDPGPPYPANLLTQMVYGPMDLSRATAATVSFMFWLDTPCGDSNTPCGVDTGDHLLMEVSRDGTNWAWISLFGHWHVDPRADARGWARDTEDLVDFLGDARVWLRFTFETNGTTGLVGGGAYVDDVHVDATLSGGCPAPSASIASVTTDRQCYAPGAQMGVLVDVATSRASQAVRVRAMLLSGDVGIASGEVSFTAPGQRLIPIDVPAGAATGDDTILVTVYDAQTDCIEAVTTKPVRIDPTCARITDPAPTAATPTYPPPTHTPPATPSQCPSPRPHVDPSCGGPNLVRNPFFEKGGRSWGQDASTGAPIITTNAAAEGFYSARFDAPNGRLVDIGLWQHIDVPADATEASFWVAHTAHGAAPSAPPRPTSGRDFFRASLYDMTLNVELVRLWEFDPLTTCPIDDDSYNLTPVDLARVRGRTVALVFHLRKETTAGWQANVLLDGVHLDVCSPSPPCQVGSDKTACPSAVMAGGEVSVMLTLTGYGGACAASRPPADVVFVLDRSGSMDGQAIVDLRESAKRAVDRLDFSADQAAVVSFSSAATLDLPLNDRAGALRSAIDALVADGDTNIADAITLATSELQSARHRAGNTPMIVLMSDGQPTTGGDPRAAAAAAKAAGIRVYTIGLGSGVDPNLMRELATSPTDYFFAAASSELEAIYQRIAGISARAPATDITITDRLSPYVTLVPNSFTGSPPPTVSTDGRTLTWRVPYLGVESRTWSYRVRMTDQAGTWPTNDSATATFTNSQGLPGTLTFPVPQVTVWQAPGHRPELLCRDHPGDTGKVPSNPSDEAWWNSPDIWVRHLRDGGADAEDPLVGQPNYVYVRVRNAGDAPVTDVTVHLYSAAGAANIRWPQDWVPEVGTATIGRLEPGAVETVSIPWTPIMQGHYCFLARLESPQDGITNEGWVPFDNNLCQRNVQILQGEGAGGKNSFGFGNRNQTPDYATVTFRSNDARSDDTYVVRFTDPKVFERWQRAGGTVRGGQVVRGTETVAIEVRPDHPGAPTGDVNASIERVPVEGEEVSTLVLERTAGSGGGSARGGPSFDVRQSVGGRQVGGNIVRPAVMLRTILLPWVGSRAVVGAAATAEGVGRAARR